MTKVTRLHDLVTRRERLRAHAAAIEKAVNAATVVAGDNVVDVRIRHRFVIRDEPLQGADRSRQPSRKEKPSATRLVSGRGSLLKLSLLMLLEAQATTLPGSEPVNTRPIEPRDGVDVAWMDLLPAITQDYRSPRKRIGSSDSYDKMKSQIERSLGRLASPLHELVRLSDSEGRSTEFDGFLLLNEGGPRPTGMNSPYVVPTATDTHSFALPATFFTRGWVHVLAESEIALLLIMAYWGAKTAPGIPFEVNGDTRRLEHCLTPTAFERTAFLRDLGLLKVTTQDERTAKGWVVGYEPPKNSSVQASSPKKGLLPNKFEFLPEKLDRVALPLVLDGLEDEIKRLGGESL